MKKRLTKMDFWVLAVVLALIAGVFVKTRMTAAMPDTMPFTYQMELTDPDGEIAPGDTVLCIVGKQPVGIVTEIRTDAEKLVLTLEAEGFPIEGGWRTNVYDILPGLEDDFYTESASWYGIVTGIS